MALIYIVDDDAFIQELLSYNLQNAGFQTRCFGDAAALGDALLHTLPALILLDVMLPGTDGVETLKNLRADQRTRDIPVIMVTAKDEELDKLIGLELGADDYITKPFSVREVAARVKAALRRSVRAPAESGVLTMRDIVMDTVRHEVTKNGEPLTLTLKEYELLKVLMTSKGAVLSRDTILNRIWGYGYDGDTRTVDVHIRQLRKILGDTGEEYIQTVRGVGYQCKG